MSNEKDSPHCPLCDQYVNMRQMSGLDAVFFNCPVCGKFEIAGKLLRAIPDRPEIKSKRYLLSAYALDLSDTGEMVTLESDNVEGIIASAARMKFDEKANHLLGRIWKKSSDMGADVTLDAKVDYPSGYCRDVEDFDVLVNFLVEKGWIEMETAGSNVYYLKTTFQGWTEAEKLQEDAAKSNRAAVLVGRQKDSYLEELLKAAYESAFQPALEAIGLEVFQLVSSTEQEKIPKEKLDEIRRCRAVVADYTGNSREVYLLAGFALGLGIPVFHTCHEDDVDRWLLDSDDFDRVSWVKPDDLKKSLENGIKETKGLGAGKSGR